MQKEGKVKIDQETAKAIEEINDFIELIPSLQSKPRINDEFIRWRINLYFTLDRFFGINNVFLMNISLLKFYNIEPILTDTLAFERDTEAKHQQAYIDNLVLAKGILMSAIDQLKEKGILYLEKEKGYRTAPSEKSIFISHGKHSDALDKIERFIRSSGFNPIIVKREASEGKAVDDLVEEKMDQCLCAIVLATCDDKVEDYYQPRPNVVHEIGLAQEKLKNKVIYLKEEGCKFSSNIGPKIWEDFTQENMEKAFEKINKELRAFKLI